jgi:hypothetical protein
MQASELYRYSEADIPWFFSRRARGLRGVFTLSAASAQSELGSTASKSMLSSRLVTDFWFMIF